MNLMISVALIAIVSTIGLIAMSQYRQASGEQKLRTDVATLNSATRIFLGSGGNFTGTSTAEEALARLKSAATAASAGEVVGLKGAMIDARLETVPLPAAEESSDALRATWNTTTLRFELSTTGAGIEEFALTGTPTNGTHQRTTAVKYSQVDNWIWDYTDRGTSRPAPPSDSTLLSPEIAPPTASAPESAITLREPSITVPGGAYALTDFPIEISILPGTGNPSDTVVFFSNDGGSAWSVYTDPFPVNPDTEVLAYSATSDPDHYSDSSVVDENYETTIVQLEFTLQVTKTSYSYAELGGTLMPGSPSAPPLAQPAEFDLANGASIPLVYQNSDTFEILYSYDGTDPLNDPASAIAGLPFTDGFPGQDIPISFAAFGSSNTLSIQAAGRSLDISVVEDSAVETITITGEVTPLPEPEIEVASSGEVSIDISLDSSEVPDGAYIYFTIDGSDPGFDDSDLPQEGQLYSAPFTPEADVQIVARVYPPAELANWFEVSPPVLETLVLPNYDVYIGGDFYLDGATKTHRNVARLATNGLIDPAFNPGNGADAGSIVGAVLRQGSSVLVGGDFRTMSGSLRPAIVRLDETGAIDGGFDAGLE